MQWKNEPVATSRISPTHLLLIPSYNTGAKVVEVVREALEFWEPVFVVIDGSNDASVAMLEALSKDDPRVALSILPKNSGKGAAVLHGLIKAQHLGFTHVLAMDADGQHPAAMIPEFMERSQNHPGDMILGQPQFNSDAPFERVHWRKMANFWTNVETLWAGIGDSLFGMRVYPVAPLLEVMLHETSWARRYDFDSEVAVRLVWRDVGARNLPCPVKYPCKQDGGVSHFNYLRDNVLLTWMHMRLLSGFVKRLPDLASRKWEGTL